MIIAELCQNHNGDMDLLREMVFKAKEVGAHFAKIQSFFAEDLEEGGWQQNDYDRLKRLELNWFQHEQFVKWCNKAGIKPMTSVYTVKYLEPLAKAGFRHIKIGSAQACEKDMIQMYIQAGFNVIMSTGGHNLSDIPKFGPITGVLHCVSKYPARPDEADLLRMLEIPRFWRNTAYGFSDHTDPRDANWDKASKLAMFLGATYIERHVTTLPRNETKDGPVSVTFDQLRELVRFDHLGFEAKLIEHPELGVLKCPKDRQELEVIKHYKTRWKREL